MGLVEDYLMAQVEVYPTGLVAVYPTAQVEVCHMAQVEVFRMAPMEDSHMVRVEAYPWITATKDRGVLVLLECWVKNGIVIMAVLTDRVPN